MPSGLAEDGIVPTTDSSGGGNAPPAWLSQLGQIAGGLAPAINTGLSINGTMNQAALLQQIENDGKAGINNANTNYGSVSALLQQLLNQNTGSRTDIRGDTTQYDPKTNSWTVTPSANTAGLLGASDAEQLARNTTDAATERAQKQGNASLRSGQRDQSAYYTGLLNKEQDPYSLSGVTNALTADKFGATHRGYEDVANSAVSQALRQGTAAAPILAQLARREGEDYSQDVSDANTQGATQYSNLENDRMNRLATPALNYGAAGTKTDTSTYTPTNVDQQVNQQSEFQQQGNNQAGSTATFGLNQGAGVAGNTTSSLLQALAKANQTNPQSDLGATIAGAGANSNNIISGLGSAASAAASLASYF